MRSSETRPPLVLYLLTTDLSTIFVRGQLAAVNEAGFDVHLATNFSSGHAEPVGGATKTWQLNFEREPVPWRDLRALFQTIGLMRRLRPTVVHAGTPKAGLLGMVAARIARVPIRCYAMHGLRYETATGPGRRLLMALEKLAANCATHVLADSASIRRVAIRDRLAPEPKILVLGHGSSNGVDTIRFAPVEDTQPARRELGVDRFDVVVGFVGRMTRDKGIDDLVSVFIARFADHPEVGLLLVGPLEDGDPIQPNTRRHLMQHPQIIHIPWLDDTVTAYAAMDVLAFPSYREGLPNVPLEAQSAGVPVVGYAATGTVDAVPDPAALCDVGDRQCLGDALVSLAATSARRQVLGDAARDWVHANLGHTAVWQARVDFFKRSLSAEGISPPSPAPAQSG